MNLIIDIGNTQAKAAIFSEGKLIAKKKLASPFRVAALKKFISDKGKVKACILCSVIKHPPQLNEFLKENFIFFELNEKTSLPIKNRYLTQKSLGKDRIANASGANHLFRGQNVLAIDSGTCIKYDFVTKRNEYEGGAISPGIDMRFKALHNFTALLPREKKNGFGKVNLVGKTTRDSILSGVLNGVTAEIAGIIKQYQEKAAGINVILTGGDLAFFITMVSKKNRIFALPDLTLLGLNVILDFNNEKN